MKTKKKKSKKQKIKDTYYCVGIAVGAFCMALVVMSDNTFIGTICIALGIYLIYKY